MKLCFIGIHRWTLWSVPTGNDIHYQSSSCKDCRKYRFRYCQVIGTYVNPKSSNLDFKLLK